jgi:hypothetical protein
MGLGHVFKKKRLKGYGLCELKVIDVLHIAIPRSFVQPRFLLTHL